MSNELEHIARSALASIVDDGVAALSGAAAETCGTALPPLQFVTGLATEPRALPRQLLGLSAQLLVPPATWAVLHLPGGQQAVYHPGSHRLWSAGGGPILVQWVDGRRQQLPLGPIEGWSADKWRVRFWLALEVEAGDPVVVAAQRAPLAALAAAARTGLLRHIEQHTHAELTGVDGEQSGLDAPAVALAERLAHDPALAGLRIVSVRVLDRQGDERQIEAATAATVEAAQIGERMRVEQARHQALLQQLDAQAVVGEREHGLRMAAAGAAAREQLLQQQAEVQQAALAARLEVVMAQIRAQTAEIARDEQLWQSEQARIQGEWERVQAQLRDADLAGHRIRLLDVRQALARGEAEALQAGDERRRAQLLALLELQQQIDARHAAEADAAAERRARHEQALLELHLRHEQLVAEQLQRVEHWHTDRQQRALEQQRLHDRQLAVIAGTAQVAAAAAGESIAGQPPVAEAGLRTLQALAE